MYTSLPAVPVASPAPDHVVESVEELVELDRRHRESMTLVDRVSSTIAAFSGSTTFIALHVAWFTVWIVFNSPYTPLPDWDPFPFTFLTMIVSLEAIFLATFVLRSQNAQARHDDRRAKVDLEVNVIAERETTKLLSLVSEVHAALGLGVGKDPEVVAMERPTYVSDLLDAADDVERERYPDSASGPDSAQDVDA